MQNCIHHNIAFANRKGMMPNIIGEQYIEQPRNVADVIYVSVLAEWMKKQSTKSTQSMYIDMEKNLVLEGNAKTCETIQNGFGRDLNWLHVYPGDRHPLKDYQHCLMKNV